MGSCLFSPLGTCVCGTANASVNNISLLTPLCLSSLSPLSPSYFSPGQHSPISQHLAYLQQRSTFKFKVEIHEMCPNSMSMERTKESLTVVAVDSLKVLNTTLAAAILLDPRETNQMKRKQILTGHSGSPDTDTLVKWALSGAICGLLLSR